MRALLLVALLLVGCNGCVPRQGLGEGIPTPTYGHVHVGVIADSVRATLDAALRDTVEHMFDVTVDEWDLLADPNPYGDSIVVVLAVKECPTAFASRRRVEAYCTAGRPTIHTHPNTCSPSRVDMETQFTRRRRYDVVYCKAQSAGTFYWIERNPLVVRGLAALAGIK